MTDNKRRARHYRLTGAGRTHLKATTNAWLRYSECVTEIVTLKARTAFA